MCVCRCRIPCRKSAAAGDTRFAKPEYYRAEDSITVELPGGLTVGAVVKLETVFV